MLEHSSDKTLSYIAGKSIDALVSLYGIFNSIVLFSAIFDRQNIDGRPPVLLETVEKG